MKALTTAAVSAGVFALAFAAWPAKAQTSSTEAQPSIQIVHTAAARKALTGTFTIEAVLTVNKDLPNGTMINFNGYISVFDSAFSNTHSVSAVGKVTGGKLNVTLTFPYTFLVATTTDKVSVNLSAYASAAASGPYYNFSANFQSTVPLPANGAATTVKYLGSI